MYQNIDKTQIYYLYDYVTNKHTCIGTKDDLFRFLASAINTNNYEDPERWSNEYFNYSNFTMEDTYSIVKNDYIRDENDKIHWFSSKDFYIRRYVFYDGEYRLIDIRNFKDEIIKYHRLGLFPTRKRFKYRCYHKKHHTTSRYRSMPKTKRTKTLNSIPEYKEFVRRRDKELPKWFDDTISYVSGSWKDQCKCKKQWGHKHKNKDKNCQTIRYDFLMEENYDMYELLEEEFNERED